MKLEENVMRILANRFENRPQRGDASRWVQRMQLLLLVQHLLDLLHSLRVAVFSRPDLKQITKQIYKYFKCITSGKPFRCCVKYHSRARRASN